MFSAISRINLLLLADFIEACGDKIVKERIQHKAMRDIYTKRKDERSKKSKRCVEREFVEVLIFPSKRSSNNACRRFWFRDRLQTQIYYEVQTVFGHIIPKNIKLS